MSGQRSCTYRMAHAPRCSVTAGESLRFGVSICIPGVEIDALSMSVETELRLRARLLSTKICGEVGIAQIIVHTDKPAGHTNGSKGPEHNC